MKKEFYTMVCTCNVKKIIKVEGYIIKTLSNTFGIYKNEYNDFDIIDLQTGLSVNYLNYYRLKDIKQNINLFDDKLNLFKERSKKFYEQCKESYTSYLEALEN